MNKLSQKIPEGWSVKRLGDICLFSSGGTPSKSKKEYWNNGTIKWLSAKYIDNNKVCGYDLITDAGKVACKIAHKGDIILVTRVSVGKLLFCNEDFAVNQDLTIIHTTKMMPLYLFNVLMKKNQEIIDKSQGLAIKGITKEALSDILFLLPPLAEQEKIADILGTWDEVIEKLSNLIEQKKLLKKGLMQKLFTGKTRLSGFTQPWKEVAIQDFCNIKRGGSPRPIENYLTSSDDGLNWLKIGDISPDAKYIYKTESKIKKDGVSKTTLVHSDDFILSNSMSFGRPYIMKIDACIHDGWLALTSIKKDVSKEFLFYLLSFSETQKKFNICAAGSGVRNLNKDIVGEVKIQLPPYYEQQAIADVLSTADDEINLLNQKLEALKEQKKGLMQQLLTGQIRVKVN